MRLKNRIKAWTEKRSIEVQPDLSSDIEEIAGNSNKEICAMFPKGSFQRLFWEQQVDNGTTLGSFIHPLGLKP